MTVLADQDIAREMAYGDLNISPVEMEEQLQPNSLDIRLGNEFSVISGSGVIDTKNGVDFEVVTEEGESIVIEEDGFVLADTIEYFDIPDYLYAELKGRSSFARLGIEVHSTGGVIDSGFSGDLVLEISNNSPRPVKLYSGMRIAQVIFHELKSECNNPYSSEDNKYQGQEGVVHSRIEQDFEG